MRILLLFLSFQTLFSQQTQLDKKFFLLGTLTDYMGRERCKSEWELVDHYYLFEKSLLQYNYSLLKKEYPDLQMDSINRFLKSKRLGAEINSKFDFKYNGFFCSKEENEEGIPLDSAYSGSIRLESFKTKKEKISYLTGVYVRYGKSNKEKYTIRIANSVSTFPVCVELLKQLGCKNVTTEIIEAIPSSYIIYFTPTKELEKYLIDYLFLRKKINDDYMKMITKK